MCPRLTVKRNSSFVTHKINTILWGEAKNFGKQRIPRCPNICQQGTGCHTVWASFSCGISLLLCFLIIIFFLKQQLGWMGKSRAMQEQHYTTPNPVSAWAACSRWHFSIIPMPHPGAVSLACKRILLSSFITLVLAACLAFWFTSPLSDFLTWWHFLSQHWNSHLHVPSGFCALFSLLKIVYLKGLYPNIDILSPRQKL